MENWKPVIGFEGFYEVSDLGRIRSLDRDIIYSDGRMRTHHGKVLAQPLNPDGYYRMRIHKCGDCKTVSVHTIVLEAFAGKRPPGAECCHNDGDRTNNKISNLRWDTRTGNQRDRVEHGTSNRGERSGRSRLSEKDVIDIRRTLSSSTRHGTTAKLAREYDVDFKTIKSAATRKSWAHLGA